MTSRGTDRVIQAQNDETAMNQFIDENRKFIKACAYHAVKHFVNESDDEWSVALIAFHEAVQSYDGSKGDFRAFAQMVIRRRLTDYIRSEARHSGEILMAPGSMDGDTEDEEEITALEWEVRKRSVDLSVQKGGFASPRPTVKDEIEAVQQILSRYGFSFFDLAECSPKAEKTKRSCAEAVAAAAMVALSIGGMYRYTTVQAYSYVTLDINPSFEYVLNWQNKVLSVEAVNEDAEEYVSQLQTEVKQKTLYEALEATTSFLTAENVLAGQEDYVLVNVTSDSDKRTAFLTEEAEGYFSNAEEVTLVVTEATMEERKTARDLGISTGKYKEIETIEKQNNGSFEPSSETVDTYRDMPVKDFMRMAGQIPDGPNSPGQGKGSAAVGGTTAAPGTGTPGTVAPEFGGDGESQAVPAAVGQVNPDNGRGNPPTAGQDPGTEQTTQSGQEAQSMQMPEAGQSTDSGQTSQSMQAGEPVQGSGAEPFSGSGQGSQNMQENDPGRGPEPVQASEFREMTPGASEGTEFPGGFGAIQNRSAGGQ